MTPANIAINDISLKTRLCGLHFRCRKYWRILNHFYVIRPESYRIQWNYAPYIAITPFKVIQGHRVWYQSKAHMRFLLVINSNLAPILHRFRDIAFDRSKILSSRSLKGGLESVVSGCRCYDVIPRDSRLSPAFMSGFWTYYCRSTGLNQ